MAFQSSTDRARSLLAALALIACSGSAHASPATEAEAELRRGVTLRRSGQDAEALAAFQHALSLAPSARAQAQVALAEQSLSLWLAAERDLARALAEADDPWIKQNREVLEDAKRVVEGRLAWMLVHTNVPAAAITWNGNPATPAPDGRVRLVAGQVVLDVRAEGYRPVTRVLGIAPETTERVDVELVPMTRTAPAVLQPPAAPVHTGSTRRTAGWIVAGVGVATLAVGSVFGVRAIAKKSERDDDCAAGCSQRGVDADRAGRSAGLVSTVALFAGAAVTTTGLVLVLTAPSLRSRSTAMQLRLLGASAALSGTF